MIKRGLFTVLTLVLLSLIHANLAYSAVGVCCYVGGSSPIQLFPGSTCLEGEYVGDADDSSLLNNDICGAYNDQRQICIRDEINTDDCSLSINGDNIYQIGSQEFPSGQSIVPTYCKSLMPYKDHPNPNSCSGSSSGQIGSGVTTGSGEGSTGSGVTKGSSSQTQTELTTTSNVFNSALNQICKQAGDPFGFYITKDSCETNPNCIYNPYKAGHFNSYYLNFENLGLDQFENSCVHFSAIKKCSDYKSELSCQENKAPHLAGDACVWIHASVYSSNYFVVTLGFCASLRTSFFDYFNYREFTSDRLNLVRNPSFELNTLNPWILSTSANSQVNTIDDAHHGSSSYTLTSGSSISQIILHPSTPPVAYNAYLYARSQSNSKITLKIEEFKADGTLLNPSESPIEKQITASNNFQKIDFEDLPSMDSQTQRITITIEVPSSSSDVEIDTISFESLSPDQSNPSSNKQIFKPMQIIPETASNCNLCYDKLGLNTCTQTKSDLLGDCSYMVSDPSEAYDFTHLSDYYGSKANIYTQPEKIWESQSLPNSKLFCELYLSEQTCIDPSNHINKEYGPYHSQKGQTLCKWAPNYGCYKDSDNDDLPDVQYTRSEQISRPTFRADPSPRIGEYKREETSTGRSDFELVCDSLPPSSYLYFTAKNDQGDPITITKTHAGTIGDVKINLQAFDVLLESCDPFQIQNKLYLDIGVWNSNILQNEWYTVDNANQYVLENIPIQTYFTDELGLPLSDGANIISMRIVDQSGNIGKEWNLGLDIDLEGPTVDLLTTLNNNQIFPTTTLEYKVTDFSQIDSCKYELTPASVSKEEAIAEGLVAEGDFEGDLTQSSSSADVYELQVPIIKTSSAGNVYGLTVICSDVFGQTGTKTSILLADFNTDLTLMSPSVFKDLLPLPEDLESEEAIAIIELNKLLGFNGSVGYLNSDSELWALSTDNSLNSCTLVFGARSSISFPVTVTDTPHAENGIEYIKDIRSTMQFTTQGRQEGILECSDSNGNSEQKDLIYYYDITPPTLTNFELVDKTATETLSNVHYDQANDIYYVKFPQSSSINIDLNLELDGTITPISIDDGLEYRFLDETQALVPELLDQFPITIQNYKTSATSTIATIEAKLQIDRETYQGFEDQPGLFKHYLNILFKDKATNEGLGLVEFYLDTSNPQISFAGDIITQIDNRLYTSKTQPTLQIHLSAPSYREFSCQISLQTGAIPYPPQTFQSSNGIINLPLTDISSAIDLSVGQNTLDVECTDIYGETLSDSFSIIYDNTPPILNDLSLQNTNQITIWNIPGRLYETLTDSFVFDLEDTKEDGYTCIINLTPDPHYSCEQEGIAQTFDLLNLGLSGPLAMTPENILIGGSELGELQEEGKCSRNSNIYTLLNSNYQTNQNLRTKINAIGYCKDLVGLETAKIPLEIQLNYFRGEFTSFDFNYESSIAYPEIISTGPFEKVEIYLQKTSGDELLGTISSFTIEGINYKFSIPSGITITSQTLQDGIYTVYALGYDSNNMVVDRTDTTLIVDNTDPQITIQIPDITSDFKVYTSKFPIKLFGSDPTPGSIQKIELYNGGTKIYEAQSNGLIFKNDTFISGSDGIFSNLNTQFENDGLTFIAGEFEKTYLLTAKIYDNHGHTNTTSIVVKTDPTLTYSLLEIVDESYIGDSPLSLVTNKDNPQIQFTVSADNIQCNIIPLIDSIWGADASTAITSLGNSRPYTFDLSTVPEFDLSLANNQRVDIKLSCINEGIVINQTINIIQVNHLPDYVLTSKRGFVINEPSYEINYTIKSVGPYRPITCQKTFNGASAVELDQKRVETLNDQLNFTSLSDGSYILGIQCYDVLGNVGPYKEYTFELAKNAPLQILNISLSNSNGEFHPSQDGKIYVSSPSNTLNFDLNRFNATCTYDVDGSGVVEAIKNFFETIFFTGRSPALTQIPYQFTSQSPITLTDGENTLNINCVTTSTDPTKTLSETYTLVYSASTSLSAQLNSITPQ